MVSQQPSKQFSLLDWHYCKILIIHNCITLFNRGNTRYYLTANSCVHEGYQEYNWPDSWDVNQINTADLCGDVSSDGSGVPEQFWNCAEVKIIQDSNALMSNPTNRPTPLPTPSQFSSQAGAPVSLPSASSNSNPSPSENAQSSSRTHDKTIVGYYASWQWYVFIFTLRKH